MTLAYSEWFDNITDAIAAERQIKGWSRAKKEALIRGDFESLRLLAKRKRKSEGAQMTPHLEGSSSLCDDERLEGWVVGRTRGAPAALVVRDASHEDVRRSSG